MSKTNYCVLCWSVWSAGVVCAAAWGISHVYYFSVSRDRVGIELSRGQIVFYWMPDRLCYCSAEAGVWTFATPAHLLPCMRSGGRGRGWMLEVPFWPVVVPVAFVWLRARWRDMQRAADDNATPYSCRQCRYDLWMNLSGTCPECGAEIPADLESALREAGFSRSGSAIRGRCESKKSSHVVEGRRLVVRGT
jgi:hypothetical protein